MPIYPLELARCLIQGGEFSMSADSHRRRGGDPQLEISIGSTVQFRVFNIDGGVPQTVTGEPRANGVDFYFLVRDKDQATALLRSFPSTTALPDRSLVVPSVDPHGTERDGGKRIRPLYAIAAFRPLSSVTIQHTSKAPEFEAHARDVTLHVEYELTPIARYGSEMIELHFGARGDYDVGPCPGQTPSQAILEMTPEFYATVLAEILHSI